MHINVRLQLTVLGSCGTAGGTSKLVMLLSNLCLYYFVILLKLLKSGCKLRVQLFLAPVVDDLSHSFKPTREGPLLLLMLLISPTGEERGLIDMDTTEGCCRWDARALN